MDIQAWVVTLRWPIEIVSLAFALTPLLIMLRCWDTLPDEIPAHFGITGRPDRWGGKWQAWILPVLSIVMYAVFSTVSGTWSWLLHQTAVIPNRMEVMLLLKPGVGLLLSYVTWMTVRVARKEAESLNALVLWALIAVSMGPVFLLAVNAHK